LLSLISPDLKKEAVELLAIPVCEDKEIHTNRTVVSLINLARKLPEFSGRKDETVILYDPRRVGAERVLVQGIGKAEGMDLETFRAAAGKAVTRAMDLNLTSIWLAAPSAAKAGQEKADLTTAIFEGAYLSNHIFDVYKKESKKTPLTEIGQVTTAEMTRSLAGLPGRISTICKGTLQARNWVSMPANHKTPYLLGKEMAREAEDAGLRVTVMEEKELAEKEFGAIMAVARGSRNPPRLVIMAHEPETADRTVVLVGKGVTFDTGGINLKSSEGLKGMKSDMAGAAATAAALIAIGGLKPDIRVVGIMPLVENMPSGEATRPGDIIRTYSGKSVEIGNTDAEGRLILADALAYGVEQYKPDLVIDMATLTGACLMALGEKFAGVFTRDDDLASAIEAAGRQTHERCWRMPLPDDYKDLLKSDLADINNMPKTRWGGAITAALFLSEFVGETRWAHIDIAGPGYNRKKGPYCPVGGSGFGVRLVCEVLNSLV
jgi:leucyl aminopeptidase